MKEVEKKWWVVGWVGLRDPETQEFFLGQNVELVRVTSNNAGTCSSHPPSATLELIGTLGMMGTSDQPDSQNAHFTDLCCIRLWWLRRKSSLSPRLKDEMDLTSSCLMYRVFHVLYR